MHPPFSIFLCDEYSLLCGSDSRDISYSFEVLKKSLDVHLPFHSFLSLMHLFMHVLTSASLTKMSSLPFAAADAVARDSLLSFLISLVLLLE